VGNAVPCSLGRAIARTLISHLNGEDTQVFADFSYSRYNNTDDVSWINEIIGSTNESLEQLCLALA
jgi:DNA (cytosine-5)-methyltransferase 1